MDVAQGATEIRAQALRAIHAAGSGHPGGCLSVADLLAVLYFDVARVRPEEPDWPERDRIVVSKGHACPAWYAALALRGFFPVEALCGLRSDGHFLQGHPDLEIPGVDAVSGSLGMGLSQGLGLALGARYTGRDFRTYVILGDGDMQEGNTWEALMAAGHHGVDGLVALLDANGLQGDAPVETQMSYAPLRDKLEAFRWHVIELPGHDLAAIGRALDEARATRGRPTFLIADTVKGKGVSFMEGQQPWHGSVTMSRQQLDDSLLELGA